MEALAIALRSDACELTSIKIGGWDAEARILVAELSTNDRRVTMLDLWTMGLSSDIDSEEEPSE